MEQKNQKSNLPTLSRADIVKLLLKNAIVIVCITLVVTAACGVWSYFECMPNCTYGNDVKFYITKGDGKQALLPLLASESFAEKLLLNEYGLPDEYKGTPEYEAAKSAVIALNEAREQKADAYTALVTCAYTLKTPKDPVTGEVIPSMAIIEVKHTELVEAYTSAYDLLNTYKSAGAEGTVTEEHTKKIAELEIALEKARVARDSYIASAYSPALAEKAQAQDNYSIASRKVADTRKLADELVEIVVAKWRDDPGVQSDLHQVHSALSFAYAKGDSSSAGSAASTDGQNVSFLTVSVRVDGDEEMADLILDRVKTRLPEFAEKNIERLESVAETNCTLISPFSKTANLNQEDMEKQVAITTVIAFVVALVLTCLVIVAIAWIKMLVPKPTKKAKASTETSNE